MSATTPPDHTAILDALAEVADPELGIGIVPLGLVYDAQASDAMITVLLTLTSPTCPLGDVLMADVQEALETHFPHHESRVTLTFEPPWSPDRMSDAARAAMA